MRIDSKYPGTTFGRIKVGKAHPPKAPWRHSSVVRWRLSNLIVRLRRICRRSRRRLVEPNAETVEASATRGGANLRKDELRASSRARRAPRGLTGDTGSSTVRPSEHPLTQSRSAARGGATFAVLCMAIAAISLGRLRASTNTAAVFVAEVDDAIHPISAELMVVGHRPRRRRRGRGAGLRPAHAGRAARLDPHDRLPHDRRAHAGRRVRRAVRRPRGLGGIPAHDRRRRRRDGAGHAHRRGASGVGERRGQMTRRWRRRRRPTWRRTRGRSPQARQRNVTLAEEAVTESRAFTEREALAASPPLDRSRAPAASTSSSASSMAARSRASTARSRRSTPPARARRVGRDDPSPALPERDRAPADRLSAPDASACSA